MSPHEWFFMNWSAPHAVFLRHAHASLDWSPVVSFQKSMEWPGDSPEDRALVAALPPDTSSEMDAERSLRNTKEKLSPNANRSVRHVCMSAYHLLHTQGDACLISDE